MAEPKNPYNNIEKELTLVGNPILDPDPIDVQVDEEPQIEDDVEITDETKQYYDNLLDEYFTGELNW